MARRKKDATPDFEESTPAPQAPQEAPQGPQTPLDGLFTPGTDDYPAPPPLVELKNLKVHDLISLRHEIDALLPPRTLEEVNLVEELMLQYQAAKSLFSTVLNSVAVPANQKAQVLNTCTSVLEQITRTQTALYTAERIKLVEQALEKTFALAAPHLKQEFFDRYEALLREESNRKREKKGQNPQ